MVATRSAGERRKAKTREGSKETVPHSAKYLEVATAIENHIQSLNLQPHDVLPAERELQESFQVSRATIRRAIAHLIEQGSVYARRGSGTYVNDPSLIHKAPTLTSFTEDMLQRGLTPSSKVLHCRFVPAPLEAASALGIHVGTRVITIERIRLADDSPMAIERAYMPETSFGGELPEPTRSLDAQLQAAGFQFDHAKHQIKAINLGAEEAYQLDQPVGAASLYFRRTLFNTLGTPIQYCETYYRGDRYGLDLTVCPSG